MSRIHTGIQSSDIKNKAQHVLFVEGTDKSIDIKTLKLLFENKITIEPLGSCNSLSNVAESLYKFHPYYYFIIDRDHNNDEFVER
ncbi:MAG: hypothetical protein ACRC2T_09625, partial [Thermoguttaceae bacterium]